MRTASISFASHGHGIRLASAALALVALSGCVQPPPRADTPAAAPAPAQGDDTVRRLEQRLAELERKVNASPAAAPAAAPAGHGAAVEPRQLPAAALQLLTAGNAAFAEGRPRSPDLSQARVAELSSGQKPYAVIVGCADSRTPPEHIFSAGLGDLFVVRCAGNVVDEAALASVEYAVAHLNCRLVVVMGHTSCGAVKAAIADAKDTPAVAGLVAHIKPAVAEARKDGEKGLADRAVRANALLQREQLRESQLLAGMERSGEVKLTVASYDLADGGVDWIDLDGLQMQSRAAGKPAVRSAPAEAPAPSAPAHH